MRTRLPCWGALAALFCAGVIAAVGGSSGSAAEKAGTLAIPTVTAAATTTEEPTIPQTTVQQTTVQVTVTNTQTTIGPGTVVVNPPATTSTADTSSGTQTWALVAIGIAIVILIGLIGWLASRHKDLSAEARRRALGQAVAAWVAQGYAPVNQTDTTAVLRRGDEHVVLTVDGRGNISSQPVAPAAPTGAA
jgi:hypothetical protein